MSDPVTLALIALLAPVGSFLLIAVLFPLRRSGKPAAYVSILAVAASLAVGAFSLCLAVLIAALSLKASMAMPL